MTTLKIYHGAAAPLTAGGKHQVRLLGFAERYPGWHSYANDRATLRAIAGLERRGSIIVSRDTRQFAIPYLVKS